MKITSLHDRAYITLDDIDRQIIDELNKNARASSVDISKVVGLTRVAVQLRIHTLMEHGVIEQFSVSVNPDTVGLYVQACMDIKVNPSSLNVLAEELITHEPITYLCQLTGETKLRAHGQFKNHTEMGNYVNNILYALPGVTDVEIQILFKEYKNRMPIRKLTSL